MNRRHFLQTASMSLAAVAAGAGATSAQDVEIFPSTGKPRFQFSLKYGMVNEPSLSLVDKFKLLKDIGYDGVEMDSQYVAPAKEVFKAVDVSGLPVPGVVNANHWSTRLSDPSPDVRKKAVQELLDGIRFSHDVGGSSILLVPGAVRDKNNENKEQVWRRSIEGIREAIPLAAEKGVRICIENVWNQFLYQHGDDAPTDQTADEFVRYLDEINSAWVGMYFDIGNHRKYGDPVKWIHTLGRRIVRCDVKDYRLAKDGKEGFCDIGDGSVDWPATRKALADVNYFGWASAEVGGGNRERLAKVLGDMRKTLLGAA